MTEDMDWMVRIPDLPGGLGIKVESPPPQIFPRDKDIRECHNKSRGCTKKGLFNKIWAHQTICTFPPYTSHVSDNVRRHKSKGLLCLALGSPDTWVSFNNSLMREPLLQAQFLFIVSPEGGKVQIQALSRCLKTARYKISFKLSTGKHTIKGCFDGTQSKAFKVTGEKILPYKAEIRYQDLPIILD